MSKRLDASVPANNWKIIELYNKLKKDELDPRPYFQRKLVWKKRHKYKFIETVLMNYPFPEIYIAPGEIDTETFEIKDIIVDGQQRSNAIRNYIEETGDFALGSLPIKKYTELSKDEKEAFLGYEVSIRYLKNADQDQISEIFQRINNTEYSLNKTERLNAQWGESEFICFGKQLVEEDLDIDLGIINYTIEDDNRIRFLNFFHTKNKVFTENDVSRMFALQYVLTLLATIIEGNYFRRNDKVQDYIESYYEEFTDAGIIEVKLLETLEFIDLLELSDKSYWFNKANLFTLVIELYKFETVTIDGVKLKAELDDIEDKSLEYNRALKLSEPIELDSRLVKYFEFAREAVNETTAREYRGELIREKILECENS